MQACIHWARERAARRIVLYTNSGLTAALSLYEKYGFETTSRDPHPDYDRADVTMILDLSRGEDVPLRGDGGSR